MIKQYFLNLKLIYSDLFYEIKLREVRYKYDKSEIFGYDLDRFKNIRLRLFPLFILDVSYMNAFCGCLIPKYIHNISNILSCKSIYSCKINRLLISCSCFNLELAMAGERLPLGAR